jgi:3-hydroxy-D-aspartate aldolase
MADTKTTGLGPNQRLIGVAGSRRRLSTPALLLDLDVLDRNIAAMAAHVRQAGVQLRPHSKGGKSVAVAQRQIAAGAIGICCATIGEAEVIVGAGIENVLITSPIVTPPMIDRLIALNGRTKGLIVVADNPANVDALAAVCARAGQNLSLLVDFDVGQGRTGTTSAEAATHLAQRIQASPQLHYAGVQGYYGHLQHVTSFSERQAAAETQMARLRALLEHLAANNAAAGIVSGGGTGTFDIDPAGRIFTEVQAGSYPFMDREYVEIDMTAGRISPFAVSLFVQASVVSANRPGFAVVNAGYKSFATEGGMPVVVGPQLTNPIFRLMGDEHGGIQYDPAGTTLKIGDAVEFVTPHCDPTINLYDRYHCVRGDTLVEVWPVNARGC